ncbi:hypothetical protein B566_EDAN006257 [Ephemera danica]|nr:hypothetical protein B566_EDAN006257 [Ephemera danica]
MGIPDKILNRKLKKREKTKLKVVQMKEDERKREAQNTSTEQSESSVKLVTSKSLKVGSKRTQNGEESGSNKAKKRKRQKQKLKEAKNELEKEAEESDEEPNDSDNEEEEEANKEEKETAAANDDGDDMGKMLPGSGIAFEVMSDSSFSTLEGKVCEPTLQGIADMGFTNMTEIQARSIPPLLEGRDLVGSAKTGSGTGCIVISPTRELSMQTFGVLKELMKHHHHTYGLLMGGANRQAEAQKIAKGTNI